MKSHPIVRLLLLAFAIFIASHASALEKKAAWKISGQLEESCSCNAACPCWFDSLPTRMHCSGDQVLFIQHGRYGNVSLDGLAIANFSQSPDKQTMMQSFGKWDYSNLYIDEKATPEQRRALEQIGRTVLPVGASTKVKVRIAPITRTISGGEHKITIGRYGSFRGHLIEGGLGGTPKISNPPGADPLHASYQQGRTSSLVYNDVGEHWNFSGTNYMFADFSVNSAQYEKFLAGLSQKMAAMKKTP